MLLKAARWHSLATMHLRDRDLPAAVLGLRKALCSRPASHGGGRLNHGTECQDRRGELIGPPCMNGERRWPQSPLPGRLCPDASWLHVFADLGTADAAVWAKITPGEAHCTLQPPSLY